jgi:NAD(P)-dependent dehydrogenase (short-subunit alcohol dehydrogenase family)
MQCAGKVVLVTGAQQGIGRAMAIEFAAAGADVAINWLDDELAAEGVAGQVRSQGRRALTVKADVAQIEQSRAMAAAVEQGLGPIDVLINNAGVFPRVSFLEMSESDWDYVLDVNLKGASYCLTGECSPDVERCLIARVPVASRSPARATAPLLNSQINAY